MKKLLVSNDCIQSEYCIFWSVESSMRWQAAHKCHKQPSTIISIKIDHYTSWSTVLVLNQHVQFWHHLLNFQYLANVEYFVVSYLQFKLKQAWKGVLQFGYTYFSYPFLWFNIPHWLHVCPQSLQANTRVMPLLGQDHVLANPFKFINHPTAQH